MHIGQLAVVIGALVAYGATGGMVGCAIGFLVLSIAQLVFLGDTETSTATGSTGSTASSR